MQHAVRSEARRETTLLYIGSGAGDESLLDWLRVKSGPYRTLFALQGRVGCELARRASPDLVLVGNPPPDMSVAAVVAELRASGRRPAPPVLLLAAGGSARTCHDVDAVLDATCEKHELHSVIQRLLGRSG